MKTKVSVVIPTRERAGTLKHALRTVIEQTHTDIEIIVSDNASSPATRNVVEEMSDHRIRYVNTGRRVSMTENFEFALGHVTGDWIAVIGDDDGLLPSGLERGLATLDATGAEALGSRFAHYRWPTPDNQGPNMYLTVPVASGFEMRDSIAHLRSLLAAKAHYTTSPMLYTGGIVSAELFWRIKTKSGHFFHSQIPDVYSAFAICSSIKDFVFMHEPLMIGGSSQHSTGANLLASPGSMFQSENTISLHAGMALEPGENPYLILPTLIYESYLQTRFLRPDDTLRACPAEQLELAMYVGHDLAKVSEDWASFLTSWGKRFADRHGFIWAPRKDGLRRHLERLLAETRQRACSLTSFYRIDRSLGLPYENVYDAAMVTEEIVRAPPSHLGNILKSVRRRFR